MKKIFIYLVFLFSFMFLGSVNVSASDYQGSLGYDYSVTATRFYFFITDQNVDYVEISIESINDPQRMIKDDSGVYIIDIGGDLKEKEYYYNVCYTASTCKQTIDPFSFYINKDGNKNIILDTNSTTIEAWDNVVTIDYENKEKIYAVEGEKFVETINDSESLNNSVFQKLIASAKISDINIGFDYITNSGMNYLEIGNLYDSNNYYSPNHNYSSKIDNYSSIIELKQLVKEYKLSKMNIILRTDFINPSSELKSTLQLLSNDYIVDGKINLNNSIMKRYISEVYKYWVEEYKVDGFYIQNADLYGEQYLNELISTLKSINEKLFIYSDSSKSSVYTSDSLQEVLLGSLSNATNEGIVNGNFSKESMVRLVNLMSENYYSNPGSYKEKTHTTINNFGSFEGLDVYAKLVLISGLGVNNSIISNKVRLALQTLFASSGIPRIIAGNEFLNVNIIPSSDIDSIPNDEKICNQSNSICYLIGKNKTIEWNYLVRNSSSLNSITSYREKYESFYPNYTSLTSATNLKLNEEFASKGILYLTIEYEADSNGQLSASNMVINFSSDNINVGDIKNKEKTKFGSLIVFGDVDFDDSDTNISSYTFYNFSYYRHTKLPNWVYLVVVVALLGTIFGLRYLLIKTLQTKKGIDYTEVQKQEREERKKNKKNKTKVKKTTIFEKFLGSDPLIKELREKNKVEDNKQNKETDLEDKEVEAHVEENIDKQEENDK